jgi:hypothetical protein
MFRKSLRLPSNDKQLRPLDSGHDDVQSSLDRIKTLQHARMLANQKLVEKAIKAGQIRNQSVKTVGFHEGE